MSNIQYFNNFFVLGKESTCSSDEPGFPMSEFLKPFKLHISRNATMVAQQVENVSFILIL